MRRGRERGERITRTGRDKKRKGVEEGYRITRTGRDEKRKGVEEGYRIMRQEEGYVRKRRNGMEGEEGGGITEGF